MLGTLLEHFFAILTNWFPTLRTQDKMKVFQRPVIGFIVCAIFFTNAATCANGGNQISDKFSCPPPTLDVYLNECYDRKRQMNN